jgi:hypothetical protein
MTTSAYAAYTDACTFFLDENGVCLRVVLTRRERRAPHDLTRGGRTRADAAEQCVGAQYVASIDRGVAGGLVSMPQPGAPLLFAYLGADGRIAVVRTGPLVRFERLEPDDALLFDDDDTVEESMTVTVRSPQGMRPTLNPWAVPGSPSESEPTWKDVQHALPWASTVKR